MEYHYAIERLEQRRHRQQDDCFEMLLACFPRVLHSVNRLTGCVLVMGQKNDLCVTQRSSD